MRAWLATTGDRIARCFGYRLVQAYAPVLKRPIPPGSKLHVGCGDQDLPGYIGCDLRALEHVQLACRAWEVSNHCQALVEIYSRHMLEHLTFAEARLTLRDWFKALAPGGAVRIEVPNLQFALRQWERAHWDSAALDNKFSDARWGFAGLFGWQRECDPQASDYNQAYWDVHKSGYNAVSLRFFLEEAGFRSVETRLESFTPEQLRRRKLGPHASDQCHLIATAIRPLTAQRMAA